MYIQNAHSPDIASEREEIERNSLISRMTGSEALSRNSYSLLNAMHQRTVERNNYLDVLRRSSFVDCTLPRFDTHESHMLLREHQQHDYLHIQRMIDTREAVADILRRDRFMLSNFLNDSHRNVLSSSVDYMVPESSSLIPFPIAGIGTCLQPTNGFHRLSYDGQKDHSIEDDTRPPLGKGTEGVSPLYLPRLVAMPDDQTKLSEHQCFLRLQIEVFQASEEDVSTHTRGRNKPIVLGQVGIRCKHCSHLPVRQRKKGSTYYPASVLGMYQAAQNMNLTHFQTGVCGNLPNETKETFTTVLTKKNFSSGVGRSYWADSAKQIGLIDTEQGIFFITDKRK